MAHCLDYGDHGNDGLGCAGGLVAITNYLDAGEWTYAIVNTNHTNGIIGHLGQSVLYGVESRLSAISQRVFHIEVILCAELMPIVLLGLG